MTIPHVRPAAERDRGALYEICLKTADSGEDATALYSDPEYPGAVWAVPYLEFEPQHSFVVDEGAGAVGFVVGAADTLAFERRLEQAWWPALRRRYAGRRPAATFDGKVLDFVRSPPREHDAMSRLYPAHLHINLLPPVQGGGWGRRLIEAELDSLRQAGAAGVHLGVSRVNPRAIGFYEHLGFTPIEETEGAIWYGLRL
jgi:ribosomal protein S18 acetylase RimI-like enzyme